MCLGAKTIPTKELSEPYTPQARAVETIEDRVSRMFSIVFRVRCFPSAMRVFESTVTNDCNRLVVSSGREQSPSIGSMCLRKCDSAVFLVLGFNVPATCPRHSRMTLLSRPALGNGRCRPVRSIHAIQDGLKCGPRCPLR